MTALSVTTPGVTRLRITARGRRVLAFLAALPAVALLAFAVLSGGSALASRTAGDAGSFTTVTVTYGDTLWSIAEDVAPAHDPRDVVDAIARLNALPAGTIEIGQKIAIPAEFAPGS